METKHTKFIEPLLIKAGDSKLGLGLSHNPPKVDCRVISEINYQLLKNAFYVHDELLEALKMCINHVGAIANENEPARNAYNKAKEIIRKATK